MTQTSSKSPPPISRFSLPKFEELPDDVRARILAVQEKAGFVPNVFMVLARLREEGFTDEDGWDIASIAAFFGMSNRIANATGMRPNDEFFLMGRVPKARAS